MNPFSPSRGSLPRRLRTTSDRTLRSDIEENSHYALILAGLLGAATLYLAAATNLVHQHHLILHRSF